MPSAIINAGPLVRLDKHILDYYGTIRESTDKSSISSLQLICNYAEKALASHRLMRRKGPGYESLSCQLVTDSDESDILTEFTHFCPGGVGNHPIDSTSLLPMAIAYQSGYGS